MTLNKTYEYRLFPTKAQYNLFEQWIQVCWSIYNFCITQSRLYYNLYGHGLKKTDLQKAIEIQKKIIPSFDLIYSQVAQEVTDRVQLAYEAFFKGLKKGRPVGYPKLKKPSDYKSFTYKQNTGFEIKERQTSEKCKNLRLGKFGLVKMEYHRPLPAEPKQCRIVKKYGLYFAQFIVEVPKEQPLCKKPVELGCDPGLKNALTFSNGHYIVPFSSKRCPYLKQYKEKVKEIQQELSENYEAIKEAKKKRDYEERDALFAERLIIRRRLTRSLYKVYNTKRDAIYKAAIRLAKEASVVYIEDTPIKELMSREGVNKNNKNIRRGFQESSLYKIIQTIGSTFNFHNQELIKVPAEYTTQVCSSCGKLVYKPLKERTHSCPYCGFTEDRDVNAAIAILKIGQGKLEITPEEIVKYRKRKSQHEEYC